MGNGRMSKSSISKDELASRLVVANAWSAMVAREGSQPLGAKIYRHVLHMSPILPLLFGLQSVPEEQYDTQIVFVVHASKIYDTLNTYMALWKRGQDAKLQKEARALGGQHYANLAHKPTKRHFNPSLWLTMHQILHDLFAAEMASRLTGHREHAHFKKTLSEFVDAVIGPMRTGYLAAAAQNKGSEPPGIIHVQPATANSSANSEHRQVSVEQMTHSGVAHNPGRRSSIK